jgi:sulfate transport system permease protein
VVAESATVARRPAAVRLPVARLSSRLGGALGPGASLLYLCLIVGLPVAAMADRAATSHFWGAVSSPQARSALELTVELSIATAAINVVAGVLIAWVLVRDEFPGKSLVNGVIDLPFALPTIVAGLVLLSLYGPNSPVGVNVAQSRAAVLLALLFVTLPFVVRAVQPVLLALDAEVEEAGTCLGASGWQNFRMLVWPAIRGATLVGAGLAFARALGEFGSIVLISGNIPFHTQVASVLISGQVESGDTSGAAAVSIVLLVLALVVLGCLDLVVRRLGRRRG